MQLPANLSVGLKEWASVCDALERGRQVILLRKGGISERGDEFEVEHMAFFLFPTFLHQNPAMLRPGEARCEPASAEPTRVTMRLAATVEKIVQVKSRGQMDGIEQEHIWAKPLIDMRFSYKPEKPLYLLLLRAYALPAPIEMANSAGYAGCKSWTPLERSFSTQGARPVLAEEEFARRVRAVMERVG